MTSPDYRLALSLAATCAEDVRRCEQEVLAHWYADTRELLDASYGPYEEQTGFLSVTRDDGMVVGACRIIGPGPHGMKTLADIAEPPWTVDAAGAAAAAGIDPGRCWDVATVAVRRELGAGGRVVAAALYYGIIRGTQVNHCPWLVAVIDRRARSLLAMLGLVLHAIPGTGPELYMGSTACAPVYCHIPDLVRNQQSSNPEGYRLVTAGRGLTEVLLPPDADLRLSTGTGSDRRVAPSPGVLHDVDLRRADAVGGDVVTRP
jgi:hypothetical protein